MAIIQFESPQTPEQLTRSIMTLCPGGPVGVVLKKQGKLLLPRRMSARRVVIEHRKSGLPAGRLVVAFSAAGSGSAVDVRSGVHPIAAVFSIAIVAVASFAVGWLASRAAGAAVAAMLAAIEAFRWRRALAAVDVDGSWLAEELRRPASTVSVPLT